MAATSIKEHLQQREARVAGIEALSRLQDINLPDLADELGLTESYTWALLQTLLRRKLIRRSGQRSGKRGRPATTFRHVDVLEKGKS